MAIDTKQKRMSALHPGSPWRGPLVDATESGFTQGNRQAAAGLYSGILAGGAPSATLMAMERALFRRVFGRVWGRVN
jgi:hypothetical protein